jgi:hypothetical protein
LENICIFLHAKKGKILIFLKELGKEYYTERDNYVLQNMGWDDTEYELHLTAHPKHSLTEIKYEN